jgi:hypothetical protein
MPPLRPPSRWAWQRPSGPLIFANAKAATPLMQRRKAHGDRSAVAALAREDTGGEGRQGLARRPRLAGAAPLLRQRRRLGRTMAALPLANKGACAWALRGAGICVLLAGT